MRIVTRTIAVIAFFFAIVSLNSVVHAQANLAGSNSDVTIAIAPLSPAPGDTVSLTVESPLIDTNDSTITWYDNGTIVAQGLGETTASIVVGALGHTSSVRVVVSAPDGSTASTNVSIIPSEVDLLVDSDSYVPPFYLGRALPSAGTNIRLQAIAHLKRPNGTFISSSDITYIWKQEGRAVGTVSGRGKSSATLPAATLYGTSNIEVDVKSSDGLLSGSASVSIPAITPILSLYEDNPLLGFMYYNALGSQTAVSDNEMTFAAVPYFAQIQSPNDPRLTYEWKVNGSTVVASANDPSEVTLNGSGSGVQAAVDLNLTHSTNIFMSVNGTWNIILGSRASGSIGVSSSVKSPFTGQ
jgi:hypothetical protein